MSNDSWKVGQKVRTPKGLGKVIAVRQDGTAVYSIFKNSKGELEQGFYGSLPAYKLFKSQPSGFNIDIVEDDDTDVSIITAESYLQESEEKTVSDYTDDFLNKELVGYDIDVIREQPPRFKIQEPVYSQGTYAGKIYYFMDEINSSDEDEYTEEQARERFGENIFINSDEDLKKFYWQDVAGKIYQAGSLIAYDKIDNHIYSEDLVKLSEQVGFPENNKFTELSVVKTDSGYQLSEKYMKLWDALNNESDVIASKAVVSGYEVEKPSIALFDARIAKIINDKKINKLSKDARNPLNIKARKELESAQKEANRLENDLVYYETTNSNIKRPLF